MVSKYAAGRARLETTLKKLAEYQFQFDPTHDYDTSSESIKSIFGNAKPWENCPCDICRALGHHVMLFRGAERNRRRGFHNLFVFYNKLQRRLRPEKEISYAKES